jgi:hypothetical protein
MTQFAALLDCFVQVGMLQTQKSLKSNSPEVVQIDEKIRADSVICLETIGLFYYISD